MIRYQQPHSTNQISFQPSMIVRSALVMSVFLVIACLALTSGMTLANADSPHETATQDPPTIEASAQDAATQEVPAQVVPAQEIPEQVVPALEVPAQEVPAQDAPVPVEPAPAEVAGKSTDAEDCQVSDQYPESVRQWCGWITQYAHEADLPPDLIAGLIWYESGGDPQAYSRSGAVGLMQVMPRDGLAAEFQCGNGPCFASRPTIAELSDAQFNIQYGTRMLSGLLARFQDLRSALRAYGPKDVGYTYADKVLAIFDSYRGD